MDDKRTAEFVLGLIGGIFGIIAGIMAMTIGGIICVSYFYILSGILLIIPGIMGLVKKDQSKAKVRV
ncbi:hypothetical protein [Clostridium sp.]|uniref:hypothetical protein n=1 Tax=Clostridium sp. TaxID=1506 RepID=UPI002FDE150D